MEVADKAASKAWVKPKRCGVKPTTHNVSARHARSCGRHEYCCCWFLNAAPTPANSRGASASTKAEASLTGATLANAQHARHAASAGTTLEVRENSPNAAPNNCGSYLDALAWHQTIVARCRGATAEIWSADSRATARNSSRSKGWDRQYTDSKAALPSPPNLPPRRAASCAIEDQSNAREAVSRPTALSAPAQFARSWTLNSSNLRRAWADNASKSSYGTPGAAEHARNKVATACGAKCLLAPGFRNLAHTSRPIAEYNLGWDRARRAAQKAHASDARFWAPNAWTRRSA